MSDSEDVSQSHQSDVSQYEESEDNHVEEEEDDDDDEQMSEYEETRQTRSKTHSKKRKAASKPKTTASHPKKPKLTAKLRSTASGSKNASGALSTTDSVGSCSHCGGVVKKGKQCRGPDGELLCHPCGNAYSREKNEAEKTGKPMKHLWRNRRRLQRKKHEDEHCSNCGEGVKKRRTGPDGETLCAPCGNAYHKEKNAAEKEGKAMKHEWRDRPRRVNKVGGERCGNCKQLLKGVLSTQTRRGPDKEVLCSRCGKFFTPTNISSFPRFEMRNLLITSFLHGREAIHI